MKSNYRNSAAKAVAAAFHSSTLRAYRASQLKLPLIEQFLANHTAKGQRGKRMPSGVKPSLDGLVAPPKEAKL